MAHLLIQLIGDNKDLLLLERFLLLDKVSVLKEKGAFLIKVDGLSEGIEMVDAEKEAIRIIETINGATKLYHKKFKGISFKRIDRVNKDGTKQGMIFIQATARNFEIPVFMDTDTTLRKWISTALQHESVNKALMLYGSLEHSWKGLYMVLEVVEKDIGSFAKLIANNWATKEEIRLFKHTANNYSVTGKDARHSIDKNQPPSNPMQLVDANKLIHTILIKWIEAKSLKHQ